MKKPKDEVNQVMWAYFSPEGNIQGRSIAYTRTLSRFLICFNEYKINDEKMTYKDYEAKGFVCRKILLNISVIN